MLRNSVLWQVRDSAPPFRVLEKCQELCLRDRTATNNLVRACTSFDFQPGSRIASFSGVAEYEESTCYLTREQAQPEGIGNLMLVPNSVHFTEVCLTCEYSHRQRNVDRKKYPCVHHAAMHSVNWNSSFTNFACQKDAMIFFSNNGGNWNELFSAILWLKIIILQIDLEFFKNWFLYLLLFVFNNF